MTELPPVLMVNGVRYVREDTLREPMGPLERSFSVRELSKRTGFPESTLYDNIRRGELLAVTPNGTTKGMRVMEGEWNRFIVAKTTGSVPSSAS